VTPTFSAEFLGCKISRADRDAIAERLAEGGAEEVATGGDLHVVNGCCVTAEAVAKTRQAVRRAVASGARGVVVAGCAARLAGTGLRDIDPRVQVVAQQAEATPAAVASLARTLGCLGTTPVPARRSRMRAFLRVQDGCSFACSFCVIPLVRGASRSRPVESIVAEAVRRATDGYREIVLTGVNIGLYRDRDAAGARLGDVVRAVAAVDGIERIRISSIEVQHLDDRLLGVLAAEPKVLPHLHVPLQSGDDGVLRAMRRRYGAAAYLGRIAAARAALGGLNVTGDIIVGFPGETEEAFGATLDVAAQAGLTRVHVFPYSPRPGTRTAGDDPIPADVKRSRSERLRAAADARAAAHRAGRVGTADRVLVERVDGPGVATGYARDYTPWRIAASAATPGAVVAATAVGTGSDWIEAREA
jgi:threonylcarbamoyladenosine tRNA methylthiotransferase MtaB